MKYLIILFMSFNAFANFKETLSSDIKYKTAFGECPSQVAGKLSLRLVKHFEKTKSLYDVKKMIVEDDLTEKYFLSSYNVKYNPSKNQLKFKFDCSKPLMKVQIYKENGEEFYSSILTEDGELVDPTYEILLRTEKKLTKPLPSLAFPVALLEKNYQGMLSKLIAKTDSKVIDKMSEVILSDKGELTLIMSYKGKAVSALLGQSEWEEKMTQLNKIISYMKVKKSIPAIINLSNSKKIVVKFSDTI